MPATQIRACRIDACSEGVAAGLSRQGVCLDHYLDDAFSRIASALELCHRGQPVDSRTVSWIVTQGDFAVRMLSGDNPAQPPEQRAHLLELLLGLANVQECVRRHAVAKVP